MGPHPDAASISVSSGHMDGSLGSAMNRLRISMRAGTHATAPMIAAVRCACKWRAGQM